MRPGSCKGSAHILYAQPPRCVGVDAPNPPPPPRPPAAVVEAEWDTLRNESVSPALVCVQGVFYDPTFTAVTGAACVVQAST
jgi:hypothetical protein